MNTAEVVEANPKGNGGFVVFKLLAESIGQASTSAFASGSKD
jgi:hypothetical protein